MAQEQHQAAPVQKLQGVTTRKYLSVAVILAVTTALEVAVVYISALRPLLVPLLLGLSFVKFLLVTMYFMHLRYDKIMFTLLLGAGMVMALGTFVAIGFIVR